MSMSTLSEFNSTHDALEGYIVNFEMVCLTSALSGRNATLMSFCLSFAMIGCRPDEELI